MKTVFYIEQVEFLRDMFDFTLKNEGFRPFSVASAKECFYQVEDISPDLLIIDLATVAKDNAFDIFDKIKSHQQYSQLPLIVTGTREDRDNPVFSNYRDMLGKFISKPLSSEVFSLICKELESK